MCSDNNDVIVSIVRYKGTVIISTMGDNASSEYRKFHRSTTMKIKHTGIFSMYKLGLNSTPAVFV